MDQQAITVQLPEDVHERVKRAARGMKRPVEQALVSIVKAAMPSLERVPAEYHAELNDMEALSDKELLRVAESQAPAAQQQQLTLLLQKNQKDKLTERERQELTQLRAETDHLMLRKSYAYLLLKCRGACTLPAGIRNLLYFS